MPGPIRAGASSSATVQLTARVQKQKSTAQTNRLDETAAPAPHAVVRAGDSAPLLRRQTSREVRSVGAGKAVVRTAAAAPPGLGERKRLAVTALTLMSAAKRVSRRQ